MSEKFGALAGLITIDFVFGIVIALALFFLAKSRRPAYAVMKRNFLAYFTNPTGYVFLCLFVLLTSLAAFWTEAFFNSNLANLDQLNFYIPAILLVFIPAISMSIWAEERRQGTDELLLTLPAGDFDVVIGKYLAAVAIFTVSLLFSQICNYMVLLSLGDPDTGLVIGNYIGYWMVGLAMLAVGMVASFLTSNLTVGFVLGVLFNAPLVAAGWSEVFLGETVATILRPWSISAQLRDFEAGVVSGASIIFFMLLVALMVYLAMVLIGRRHWTGGRQGNLMGWHFLMRVFALVLITGGVSVLASEFDWFRPDVTSEQINSLSPKTLELIQEMESEYPVHIDAFLSKGLPEDYAQRRLDLRSRLRELKALGKNITYKIHEVDVSGDEAYDAEKLYRIGKRSISTEVRGAIVDEEIIFGITCRSGAEQVVTPFLGKGVPIEYELIRSIMTVTETKRKRIGILATDANLVGGASMMTGPTMDQPIVTELRKQYKIVEVNPNNKIDGKFDVLLAVQPSSLAPPQMQNFVDAVKRGIPTAIFEDPMPLFSSAPGTDEQKRGQGMLAPMQPPQEKGNLQSLWDVLGVSLESKAPPRRAHDPFGRQPPKKAALVWQDYNPHPSEQGMYRISSEWAFITPDESGHTFSPKSEISSDLQEVLFLFPGGIDTTANPNPDFNITELVRTRSNSGLIDLADLMQRTPFGEMPRSPEHVAAARGKPTSKRHLLAVHVQGPEPAVEVPAAAEEAAKDGEQKSSEKKETSRPINAVVVSDVDVLGPVFFELRSAGDDTINPITRWRMDNVPFVLNIVDVLAGDTRFVDIRKRRTKHRELKAVQVALDTAKEKRRAAREKAEQEKKDLTKKEEDKLNGILEKAQAARAVNAEFVDQFRVMERAARDKVKTETARAERRRDEAYENIDREMSLNIRNVQDRYKLWAVVLPPIPPLLIAICVFFVRREREREGVQADRLV